MISLYILTTILISSITAWKIETIPEWGNPPNPRKLSSMIYDSNSNRIILFSGISDEGVYYDDIWSFNLDSSTWKELYPSNTNTPGPRIGAAIFFNEASNQVIIAGGKTLSGASSDVWSFDLTTLAWSQLTLQTDKLQASFSPAFTRFKSNNENYYAIYGSYVNNNFYSTLYLIEEKSLNCYLMPNYGDAPYSYNGPGMDFYNGALYVWGGYSWFSNYDQALYVYNLTTYTWSKLAFDQMPNGRSWHHVAIYKNYLYAFPGTNFFHQKSDDIWMIDLNELKKWENVSFTVDYNISLRTQSSNIFINSSLFQFSGSSFTNDLISIDISAENPTFTIKTEHWIYPPCRSKSAVHIINSYLAVFGGEGNNGELLNDLWLFDIEKGKWSLKNTYDTPTPRSSFASISIGHGFMMFGGEDSTGLLSDFYIFSLVSDSWVLINIEDEAQPDPTKGACINILDPVMMLFGGINKVGLTNDLWIFDLIWLKWYHMDSSNYIIPPITWHSCFMSTEYGDYVLYVLMGEFEGNTQNPYLFRYSLSTNSWSIVYDFSPYLPLTASFSSIIAIPQELIIIGGKYQNIYSPSSITFVNTTNLQLKSIGSLNHSFYGSGIGYFKHSAYIFGGGVASDFLIADKWKSSALYKISFEKQDSEYHCSPGTFITKPGCNLCPAGSFSAEFDSEKCENCPAGTYSKFSGSYASTACIPCSLGTFSNIEGASVCAICKNGISCPVGSKSLYSNDYALNDSWVQPSTFESDASIVDEWTIILGIMFAVSVIITLALASLWRQFFNMLEKFDLYSADHNENNQPMWMKKTKIGGLFSLFAVLGAGFLIIISILTQIFDNISESQSLIPYNNLQEQAGHIKSDLWIEVVFYYYGGNCGYNASCTEYITFVPANIKGTFSSIACQLIGSHCHISVFCSQCTLLSGAYAYYNLGEANSFASFISANVTTNSSIPDEISSYKIYVSPSVSGEVFIGLTSTIINFSMTSSLFISESSRWKNNQTGYYISKRENASPGSSVGVDKLTVWRTLRLLILLKLENTGLLTVRSLKSTFLLFVSALLGSVTGIIGLAGAIMGHFEGKADEISNKIKAKENFLNIENAKETLECNFNILECQTLKARHNTEIDTHSLMLDSIGRNIKLDVTGPP
ncbi:unnamed protein product [Blepharisma stoltei]|uniref:Tyrosine-protein kinase ephrin type A/B receptor-like domain-containing protein n=1 Tax=Blepharisma stoltei TaxID=1481888 RepID=A0AAU9IAC9_9CILI|nr:unnamed protein product [Blepharisma stoltei]